MNFVKDSENILVIPRSIFGGYFSLVPWKIVLSKLNEIEQTRSWLPRREAEQSIEWVQPIPCAFIKNLEGHYCVLRRVMNTRADLKGRTSLLVGGHIDQIHGLMPFEELLKKTLLRELEEEVGITSQIEPRPVGVIVDNSSVIASRHIAIVHEVIADKIVPNAPEEFSKRSKLTG